MTTLIYHNPRCSKSRKVVELLRENNIDFTIIEYLKNNNLTEKDLQNLLNLLELPIRSLLRNKELAYKDNNLDNTNLSKQEIINIVLDHPILLERPIVIHNKKAKICRPPELLFDIL